MIFPQAEHIMNFQNPTEALTGKRTSVQGFSVYKDFAVIKNDSKILVYGKSLHRRTLTGQRLGGVLKIHNMLGLGKDHGNTSVVLSD